MSDNIEMDITKESVLLEDAEKAEPITEKADAEEAAVAEETGRVEKAADAGDVASAEEAHAAAAEEMAVSSTPEEKEEAPSPEEQIAELEDKYRRALAEVHNVRRRAEEERRNAMRYGVSAFARDMLSVCDNLGRALEAVERQKSDNNQSTAFRDLIEGIQVIQRELHDVMARHGIKQINPLGEKFDPNFHEAVFEADKESEHEFDVVVEIAQSGYMIGERLLRPARVGIARAKKSKTATVAVETEALRTESPEPKAEIEQEDEDPAKAVS